MRKRKKRWLRYFPEILLLLFFGIVAAGLYDCPLNALFNIPCPGCGMTAAAFALVRLDIKAAFREHSLFPIVVFWFGYQFVRRRLAFPKRVENTLVWLSVALFFVRWIFILFFI